MANLNEPMTDAQIKKLDYFDKAQLYHNVYANYSYTDLPTELRTFYTADAGLQIVKATISNASVKDPYEIARLIKALAPSGPQTYQEIYARAAYLANICDTTVEKVLRSNIFNTRDFIPAANEDVIKKILSTKTTGNLIPLEEEDYTPSPDSGDAPSPIPTPTPGGGDYAEEAKIYFSKTDNAVTCNTTFTNVIANLPKLPAAELLLSDDSQNILNVSCGYNVLRNMVDFNFIRMYDTTLELFTIHYSPSSITYEKNDVVIKGGDSEGGNSITI